MDYTTIEAEIQHGHVLVKEPEKLPNQGRGLLILFPAETDARPASTGHRVQLPLIEGDGKHIINPTREELDESAWD
jgi:hypothetical protein